MRKCFFLACLNRHVMRRPNLRNLGGARWTAVAPAVKAAGQAAINVLY